MRKYQRNSGRKYWRNCTVGKSGKDISGKKIRFFEDEHIGKCYLNSYQKYSYRKNLIVLIV